jgi:t-SNARE complex subunit (syntaxin)
MEEKTIEGILKLKDELLNSMDFKKLLAYIRSIDEYFRSNTQPDVETALKTYQKAIQLLTAARMRLMTLKKEKEELDRKYSQFLASISEGASVDSNYGETETEVEEEPTDTEKNGRLPF